MPASRDIYVSLDRARAYVVCSLTVALSLRQSPHINQQIALNELPADMCERAGDMVLHPAKRGKSKGGKKCERRQCHPLLNPAAVGPLCGARLERQYSGNPRKRAHEHTPRFACA